MRAIFDSYGLEDEIPVNEHLRNRKLRKFFNRETEAALVGVGRLTKGQGLDPKTPFYYAANKLEFGDYGLSDLIAHSTDENGRFSRRLLFEVASPKVSPLTLFKVLQNMPLSFIAIEYGLTGDNSVIFNSASGLLLLAMTSVHQGPVLLGASRTDTAGTVLAGFALVTKDEIRDSPFFTGEEEAVDMLRCWAGGE